MENYPSADDAIRRRPTGGPVTLTASVPVMTMTTPYRPHLAPVEPPDTMIMGSMDTIMPGIGMLSRSRVARARPRAAGSDTGF